MRVLIVDDAPSTLDPLGPMMQAAGHDVTSVDAGPAALRALAEVDPEVVLLDLVLPGSSGLDLCSAVRARSTVPLIIVSGRDSEVDRVLGLELGADDYVTRPYSRAELLARIHAVVRRRATPRQRPPHPAVSAGPVRLDSAARAVTVNGREIPMPRKEFDLLDVLVSNAGHLVTRDQIYARVWGPGAQPGNKTLEVHIKRLRTKLEPQPGAPRHLITIRGRGYRFDP